MVAGAVARRRRRKLHAASMPAPNKAAAYALVHLRREIGPSVEDEGVGKAVSICRVAILAQHQRIPAGVKPSGQRKQPSKNHWRGRRRLLALHRTR